MRTEQQMYQLILDIAQKDDRVLAVYMNGSRTNKNVPRDIFQDYDIVYVVPETKSFMEDKKWIEQFGEIMYMQYPEDSPFGQSEKEKSYGWLMQFTDGNRIDLHVVALEFASVSIKMDRLCRILLDKGNYLPDIVAATDEDFWIKKPSEEHFLACCNEFWWCSNNLAKGLWRDEILYVQDMTNFVVRKELERMLSYKVGILTDYSVSVGKSAKYIKNWLSEDEYERYLNTFFGRRTDEAKKAIIEMCELFKETALFVADKLGYSYNRLEGESAASFLKHVIDLPKDAKEIY
jgi:aminoglycoside 6-adenylyltransferase